jgi:predicted nucleic acid-binding Zn ribbon protein
MQCSNCGAQIPRAGKVCPMCHIDKTPDKKRSRMITWWTILGFVVGLIVGISVQQVLVGLFVGLFIGCAIGQGIAKRVPDATHAPTIQRVEDVTPK